MNRLHVRAFTIMEVAVAMLIAGIVIVMTYSIYGIVLKSYYAFNQKHNDRAIVLRVDELLTKDFRRADKIVTDKPKHITIEEKGNVINYDFEPGYIVRSAVVIDTFKMTTQNMISGFEGVVVPDTNPSEMPQIIDELQLTIVFDNKTFPYHYRKQYSSADLLM